MLLRTPESLHYPITVTKLLRRPGDQVDRDAPLFNYTYESIVVEGSEEDKEGKPVKKTWPATFESYLEGTLTSWSIEEGKVIYKAKWVLYKRSSFAGFRPPVLTSGAIGLSLGRLKNHADTKSSSAACARTAERI